VISAVELSSPPSSALHSCGHFSRDPKKVFTDWHRIAPRCEPPKDARLSGPPHPTNRTVTHLIELLNELKVLLAGRSVDVGLVFELPLIRPNKESL
jgi:hypothetical protein